MTDTATTTEKRAFEAEVSKVLELVVNSLYTHKEIFLRELISNASDACDRLRYAALTEPALLSDDPKLTTTVTVDRQARTLTVVDNGIGMNREELIEDLGTIAGSGTAAFVDQLTGDAAKDVALIGQFGVGFYSTFMVAKEVVVTSRKAGEEETWRWRSRGKGDFTVAPAEPAKRGTAVTLHLRKGEDEFLEPGRLRAIVKTYSDHIAFPIVLEHEGKSETVNEASALWTRPKSEITEEQYREFYHHTAHAFDDPWLVIHNRAEGRIEYTNLLFIPSRRPFDLFFPERKHRVKLYVKRVFITDDCDELVPSYLRFLKGIVDSEDLPLNISRETLQHNPLIARIRSALMKRVFAELKKKAEKEPEAYAEFWGNFGAVLKEGLYEDAAQQEPILELARFHSTASADGLVGLDEYVGRMKTGQKEIYYLSGESVENLRQSPHLEAFKARGVEVLFTTDPIDEFWLPAVGSYRDKSFSSVTKGGVDLSSIAVEEGEAKRQEEPVDISNLIALFRLALGKAVKDVRVSSRLTDSPVCLVADEHDIDMHLERLLKQHKQITGSA
ncbi:MAG: molecular chaperone HtpG, partial [Alphaproteobacteria bacterium]